MNDDQIIHEVEQGRVKHAEPGRNRNAFVEVKDDVGENNEVVHAKNKDGQVVHAIIPGKLSLNRYGPVRSIVHVKENGVVRHKIVGKATQKMM